jgi:tetratricopeptide (TPR) repeat protein
MKLRMILSGLLLTLSLTSRSQNLEQAQKDVESGRYRNAKKILEGLIAKEPLNPQYLYNYGEVYYLTGKSDSAKFFFEKGIKADPNSAINYIGLGKTTIKSDELQGRKYFEKALSIKPHVQTPFMASPFMASLTLAEFYISRPDFQDLNAAISLLDKALKHDPGNPKLYILYGDVYWNKNEGMKALENFEKAMKLNPGLPEPYLKIGRLYTRAMNTGLAMENYQKGILADSNYALLYKDIAELQYKSRQYDKGLASYKKYMEKTDWNDENQSRYASFFFMNKNYPQVIKILSELTSKNYSKPIAYRLLSYSYYETGDFVKGLESMEKFWKLNDATPLASDYEYYGRLLAKNKMDSLAVINFNKALQMDSSKADLYSELGNIYFYTEKYPEACRAYHSKCKRKEVNAQDYFNYGRALYFGKDYNKADSIFARLNEVKPDFALGYLWRARVNSMFDPDSREGKAKPFYEKFIKLTGAAPDKYKKDLAEAYSYMGYYYLLKNDQVKAKAAWKKVKEFDPSDKKADEALKALSK